MNSKTIDTALIYLSAGCLAITIVETVTRGISFGYLWLMFSVLLWLAYMVRKRNRTTANGGKESGKTGDKRPANKTALQDRSKKVRFGGRRSRSAEAGSSKKQSPVSKRGQNRNNEQ
ncbi:hypothetical protein D770_13830 [Flammeovirgaceae bacterium 311]|nr:hypothetical protein D770_13830 [Flammeovirgaceae bacterium 311]